MHTPGFSADELRLLKQLSTPPKIQQFIDTFVYNIERGGETCRSPRRVLRDRTAHCFEGALFAAAALRANGRKPLVVDLVAVRDDDHVIAVFREKNLWGAVAQSNFSGLGYRPPVFKSVRELAMSYFEQYFNVPHGEYTLRRYSLPVDLARFDSRCWMTSEEELFWMSDVLAKVRHYPLVRKGMRLGRVRERVYRAGCLGRVRK